MWFSLRAGVLELMCRPLIGITAMLRRLPVSFRSSEALRAPSFHSLRADTDPPMLTRLVLTGLAAMLGSAQAQGQSALPTSAPQTMLSPAGLIGTPPALAGLPALNAALATPTMASVAVANGELME